MSDDRYADVDLMELVQAAFSRYILEHMPELLEKYISFVEQSIIDRINGRGYAPEFNHAMSKTIQESVDTHVGNYLRVGKGRDIVNSVVLHYLDKKLESHIEETVRWRVNKLMDKVKKDLDKVLAQ